MTESVWHLSSVRHQWLKRVCEQPPPPENSLNYLSLNRFGGVRNLYVMIAFLWVVGRADQNTGGALLEFPVRTAVDEKSRVSSAIKYDFFKFDDSGNCITAIR